MAMWRSLVVCCVLVAVGGATSTGPISECTVNPGAFPLAARVAGCAAAPCALPQLEDAVIDISFRAPRDSSTLKTTVTAYLTLMGISIPVPYDLAEKSATCNYLLNSSCPVHEGDILLYTLSLYIEPVFPVGVATTLEVSIQDEAGAAACLRVPIVVEAPRV